METDERTRRIGVLGAGISGLAAARALGELGHEVVVFDKGRGPGGRASSRRAAPFAFDHGAQYFTARDPEFRGALGEWLEAGVVARWEGRLTSLGDGAAVRGGTERFVGVPRMSALAQHLARGVELCCGTRVTSIERDGSGCWHPIDAQGADLGTFDRLLVTLPPPQAAELIGGASPLGERATNLATSPCWAVLLGLAGPYDVAFDGAFCQSDLLSWVCRDSSKPGRPAAESWVLHASPDWSERHLGARPDVVIDALAKELVRLAGVELPPVQHRDAHLWRFARPGDELYVRVLVDRERGLVLAGDAYTGGRVEGAYLSGLAAARELDLDPV